MTATEILQSIDTTGRLAWPLELPLRPKSKQETPHWEQNGLEKLMQQYQSLHRYAHEAEVMLQNLSLDYPEESYVVGVVRQKDDSTKLQLLCHSNNLAGQLNSKNKRFENIQLPVLVNKETDRIGAEIGSLVLAKVFVKNTNFLIVDVECNFGKIR